MAIAAKKVVLVSTRAYDASLDHVLHDLLERGVELFCVVGTDCVTWEEVMDELIVGLGDSCRRHVTTTSHPEASLADVIAFAALWEVDGASEVEIVEV